MPLERTVLVFAAMAVLAALDFVGAMFAKSYADHRQPWALVLGLVVFAALFIVYTLSLRIAQLSIVTIGWIVLLQVGLLAVDQRLFGLDLRWRQWVAVAMIIVLQCYLVVTTDAEPAQAVGRRP